ncbi:hypothetical protein QAD02_004901 [Eretmocerus hayati]|uniref:Uncharacterized protein n=1 Tax=Eretmocerus hayati TaxID=131215 RepID=A0ACC2NTN0_9HYME|nr:hypothetical protein QAD02_004901 [Eretmocerus hayati]
MKVYIMITQIMGFVLNCGATGFRIDYLSITSACFSGLAKVLAIDEHMDEIGLVFSSILDDWATINEDKLRNAMTRFAKIGRSAFKFQMGFVSVVFVLMVIGPLPFLAPPLDEISW